MGHRAVEGDDFRTRYEGAPEVRWVSVEDASLAIEITFQVESSRTGEEATFTTIRFDAVLEFRWVEFDFSYHPTDRDDTVFALIEIIDSELVELLIQSNSYAHRPVGQRLGGVLDERDLRHFRISFDDYGSFDIVCLRALWNQHVKPSPDREKLEPFDGHPI